jgi:hypothetical protein
MCRLSLNLGATNSWNPQGLSRPVMGLICLILTYLFSSKHNKHVINLYLIVITTYAFSLCLSSSPSSLLWHHLRQTSGSLTSMKIKRLFYKQNVVSLQPSGTHVSTLKTGHNHMTSRLTPRVASRSRNRVTFWGSRPENVLLIYFVISLYFNQHYPVYYLGFQLVPRSKHSQSPVWKPNI